MRRTATWRNDIGAASLAAHWVDPDFKPDQRAFYYARVLEIPTPRWTTYDARRFGIASSDRRATWLSRIGPIPLRSGIPPDWMLKKPQPSGVNRLAVDATHGFHDRLRDGRMGVDSVGDVLRQQLAGLGQQQLVDQLGGVVANDMRTQ